MFKNSWFMLIVGLIVGLCLGYILAERQAVPPANVPGVGSVVQGDVLPEGHPPVPAEGGGGIVDEVESQIAELQQLLAQSPGDTGLIIALGNTCFDGRRWEEARMWYEQAVQATPGDVNVLTDLAVVYRNLQQPERSLGILDEVVKAVPGHWQAWYNRVIVLHFDLHRHDQAIEALEILEGLATENPQIPDLSGLADQVRGS